MLTAREREVLEIVECQGDEIDVAEIAAAMEISQNTLKSRVKKIREKLAASPAEYWLEDLPAKAREQGVPLAPCEAEMPDDGSVRVDGTVPAL